jgi:hypothetical protein
MTVCGRPSPHISYFSVFPDLSAAASRVELSLLSGGLFAWQVDRS